jgi:hypothetical protein
VLQGGQSTVGGRNGSTAWIKEGLAKGDTVIRVRARCDQRIKPQIILSTTSPTLELSRLVTQGRGQQGLVAGFDDGAQVLGDVGIAVEVFSGVEAPQARQGNVLVRGISSTG